MLCEINPLIVTPEGEVKALDSKFTVDDSALPAPGRRGVARPDRADPIETFAREKGVTYVKLDGTSACSRTEPAWACPRWTSSRRRAGARRTSAISAAAAARRGRRRARGDHARRAGALDLLQHLRRDHPLRRGGARDPRALDRLDMSRYPIVVRLDGTNAEEGRQILADAGARTSIPRRRCSTARGARGAGGVTA
jgi:Succinyl-CoA synthetase, beta subunit